MKQCIYAIRLLICLAFVITAQAQEPEKSDKQNNKESRKTKVPQKGDIYFSPVPVFGANPAFGFIYGAGASTSWFMGAPATTQLSSAVAGIAFTTKKQTVITLKSTVFTEDNGYILMGDWRYLDSSQPTWGLGTGPQSAKLASNNFGFRDGSLTGNSSADMLKFNFFRFYETVLKKAGTKGFYAGLGLHVDVFSNFQDQLLDLTAATPVITPFYAYNKDNGLSQTKSTLVGLSLNGMYDTRDNINNTYKGRYAFLSLKVNPTFLGSDKSSTSLWMEYRDFFSLTPDHNNIVAVWALGNFTTSGQVPYMNLPAVGWDQYSKSGEPYAQGRFRGKDLIFGTVEYRRHLISTRKNPKFLGAVLYGNLTTASGIKNGISLFEYLEPGYGAGLRINISKKARTNLGLDYGWGNYGTTGFFLRLNENF